MRGRESNVPHSGAVLATRRALIDADIDPLIAALIVESMHHHHANNGINRRQNMVAQSSNSIPIRNRILTVNQINKKRLLNVR